MVDTFEPDLSDELQEEEEKIVPTLTMWPYAGSLPFEPRVLSFQQDHLTSLSDMTMSMYYLQTLQI